MHKYLYPLLLLFVLTACDRPAGDAGTAAVEPQAAPVEARAALPPGVTLVEEFAGEPGELTIPFKKYVLDNGLTVVLHEDHSDPLVHVDVTYHVGSNREEPGRSGFAHFFEHMMFEGSANVPKGELSKKISNAGGRLNGTTNSDRTNYYETMPANQLELALWLEADRMGLLLPAMTQEKFDIQRAAVKNERGQRIDNQPYGRVSETLMKNLYPAGHPYSWPVIGWIEDLDAATLDDLRRFFLRWYGPNNATLTIGGDIDVRRTLEWIARYFGPIPSGPEVEQLPKQPVTISGNRYVTLEDNIHLPAIAMLFPTVYYNHEDEAALDAAVKVLGQGRASLLYQNLVQTGRAVSAYTSHACRELSCELMVVVIQNPASGETLADMESAIRETMAEFAERGVNEDDLQKFLAGYEAGQVFSLQSVSGKVGSLAFSQVFFDNPKHVMDDIERYLEVTAEQAVAAFDKYIVGKPAVILSVVPQGQPELAAQPQNYTVDEIQAVAQEGAESPDAADGSEPELRTPQDDFDRSIEPTPGSNPIVDLPPIWDTRLENGARLLVVQNTETPTVSISATFAMGQRDEPPGKAGLASLTAALMHEATTEHSASGFSEELERIGASVTVSAGQYETSVSLNVLSKYLDKGMALMMERMLQPAFTEEDFDRIKSQTIESLQQSFKNGPALANRALGAVLYGPTHPLSYPGPGLPATVENVTLDDVKAFYSAHIPQSLTGVLVSSSVSQDAILASLQPLAAIDVAEKLRDPAPPAQEVTGRTVYLVDKPGAAQSSVRMAHHSYPYDALGDYYLSVLMNYNLGGNFDSRINLNLREQKGHTYGASTGFTGGPEYGSFRFSSEVNKDATTDAIRETLAEIEQYAESGMTEEEYRYMQNAIGQSDALNYETPGAKLGLLDRILEYDLPLNYRKQQQSLLQETDRETLNALAARALEPDNLAIVVAGDLETIRPEIDALGLPVVVLDEGGEIVD
jgi:zinc protease